MSDPTITRTPCPTCSGPVRETVGMVCQTCGTDYAPAVSAPDLDAIRAKAKAYHGLSLDETLTLIDALAAAHAETERLRAERFEAITGLAWLTPNVTQDGRLSHAVRVVRDALTTAEAERDEARAALAALRERIEALRDECRRWAACNEPIAANGGWQASGYMKAYLNVAERLDAALAAAPSETEEGR